MPVIGEIRMFAGNFAPAGWMFCLGQTLPISENDALFTLIGTTFGGDGQETFMLPNLASRVPIGPSQQNPIGTLLGTEQVQLTVQQIPAHSHPLMATTNVATSSTPTNAMLATSGNASSMWYGTDSPSTDMSAQAISPAGGSQPHTNVQPFQVVNFIISLFGTFPPEYTVDDPFMAEIRIFSGSQVPTGWAPCNGQLQPISMNTAMFALLGTAFGGDGKSTFAYPNLQGSAAMGVGQGMGLSERILGQTGGVENVTLLSSEIPIHTHPLVASGSDAVSTSPTDNLLAASVGLQVYNAAANQTQPAFQSLAPAGLGLPHDNMQPYVPMTFALATQGVYPLRP